MTDNASDAHSLTPEERWEQGIPHDPRSERIAYAIADIDWSTGGFFQFKFGGDGDNGEELLYLLDVYFDTEDDR